MSDNFALVETLEVRMVSELNAAKKAGEHLRILIQQNYTSQEEFAIDFGTDLRTVSRYINGGINKVNIIQELALFFDVEFVSFFTD